METLKKFIIKILVFSLSTVSFSLLSAQPVLALGITFDWAGREGGTSLDRPRGLARDSNGFIYVAGEFRGTADLDPGPGVNNLTSIASRDGFIQKLDASGNLIWVVQVPGVQILDARIGLDPQDSSLTVTGNFSGTQDFDPGAGVFNLSSNGLEDGFTLKLDTNGNFLWAFNWGGSSQDGGGAAGIDASGNVYTTGFFVGTVDFDPSPGVFNLNSGSLSDGFLQKVDSNGNFVWAIQFSGPNFTSGKKMDIDSAGNVYVIGRFTNGSLWKVDPTGSILWRVDHADEFGDISLDASGVPYTTAAENGSGFTRVFMTLTDGSSTSTIINLPFSSSDGFFGIDLDASSNIYLTGGFRGTIDFDPSGAEFNVVASSGDYSAFVAKYTSTGAFVNAGGMQVQTSGSASGNRIEAANDGTAFVTGWFGGTMDADPSEGTFLLTSDGTNTERFDVFLVQALIEPAPPSGPQVGDFVALGQLGVWLKSGVVVHSGDLAANEVSSGPFLDSGVEVSIGNNAVATDPDTDIFGDSLRLKGGSQVNNVSYNDLSNSGTILGTSTTPVTLPVVTLPTAPTVTPGVTDVTVPSMGSVTLGAGNYDDLLISSGGTLTLSGGVYNFDTWDVRMNGNVYFSATTEVRIAGKLETRSGVEITPAVGSGIDASDIEIFVGGINGSGGALGNNPKAADFGASNVFQANIYAPNGTAEFASGANIVGGVIAKWVTIGMNGQLTLDSAF